MPGVIAHLTEARQEVAFLARQVFARAMKHLLLVFVVAVVMGCAKNPASSPTEANAATAPTPTGAAPNGSAATETAEADPTTTTGSRMAKPGWCRDDADCTAGQVCEKCGDQAQCVPGCHVDAQCGPNERCNQVQCIRCPCPGLCETK